MPVDVAYPEYEERSLDWRTCRDVYAGPRAVRDGGEIYLPRPAGMIDDTLGYLDYLKRADFFNGFGRAVQGLHGMVFRRDPEMALPPDMEDYERQVTVNGRSLLRLARWSMREELTIGRVGLLIDVPIRPSNRQLSAADVSLFGLRPYIANFVAEDVLRLRYDLVRGRRTLTLVVLRERVAEEDPDDEFEDDIRLRYRVLELVPTGDRFSQHFYRQRLFEEPANGGAPVEVASFVPLKAGGRQWERIPFVVIDADGEPDDGDITRPPMLDLALKTLSLYRTLADLEHLAFYIGFPQPCVKMPPWGSDEQVRVGGPTLWNFTDPQADAWYMTHDGRGSETLEKLADRKRQEIALLGARMLEPDRRAVEAAATAMVHRQGELSILQSLALLVSEGLTEALGLIHEWMGGAGEVPRYELNTDYVPSGATPQMVQAMGALHASGQITDEMWFNFLVEGEVATSGETLAQFQLFLAENKGLGAAGLDEVEEEEVVEEAAD